MKTMVSFTRNHYFKVWRCPERHLVKHFACNVFQSASHNVCFCVVLQIFRAKESPLGNLGGVFFFIFCVLFQGSFLDNFVRTFGRGRRQGRGSYQCSICNI